MIARVGLQIGLPNAANRGRRRHRNGGRGMVSSALKSENDYRSPLLNLSFLTDFSSYRSSRYNLRFVFSR